MTVLVKPTFREDHDFGPAQGLPRFSVGDNELYRQVGVTDPHDLVPPAEESDEPTASNNEKHLSHKRLRLNRGGSGLQFTSSPGGFTLSPMIRPITPTDALTLADLSAETGFFYPAEIETLHGVLADYFATNRDDCGHQAVLYEDASGPVGYVYFAPEEMTDRTWYVWWIAVAAPRQGQGIGKELLAFAERAARDAGGRLLVIETSSTAKYEATRRFYLRHGYAHAATVPDLYADGDGMAIFTKRLA